MTYAQWNPQQNYLMNDIVYDGTQLYEAAIANTAKQPSLNAPATWILYSPSPPALCAQWRKNKPQSVNIFGSPEQTTITFDVPTGFSNPGLIQYQAPGKAFLVNQQGVYAFNAQLTITINPGYTATQPTWNFRMTVTRGTTTATIFQQTWDQSASYPSQYSVSVGGPFECLVGDVISFSVDTYMDAGSYTIELPSDPPDQWDLNTYWSWTLIKTTP